MQRTRLNTLFEVIGTKIELFFSNPWRRISLILIGFLFGIFVGEAVSTTVGQAAYWDVVAAGLLVLFTEIVSQLAYRRKPKLSQERSLFLDVLNVFKVGIVYSLYLEAFKLGS